MTAPSNRFDYMIRIILTAQSNRFDPNPIDDTRLSTVINRIRPFACVAYIGASWENPSWELKTAPLVASILLDSLMGNGA